VPALILYGGRDRYLDVGRGSTGSFSDLFGIRLVLNLNEAPPGSAGIPACNERFSAKRSSSVGTQDGAINSTRSLTNGFFAPIGTHCRRNACAPSYAQLVPLKQLFLMLLFAPIGAHCRQARHPSRAALLGTPRCLRSQGAPRIRPCGPL
jgi:hypothetical protein